MDTHLNPASIAILSSIGLSILGGLGSMFAGMRSRDDPTASILFVIVLGLMVLIMAAAGLIAAEGMAYAGLLKAALLSVAAFAVVCTAIGLRRGLSRANGRRVRSL